MKFGDGIDSISERVRGKGVKYQKESPPLNNAAGMDVEAYNIVCKSQKELENTFDVSAAMSFGFGLGSLGGNFQFVNNHVMTDTSVCFVIKIQVGKLASSIDDVELSKSASELHEKDPVKFMKRYGDYYVSGLKTGGAFYGTIYIECRDENRKKEVNAGLNGKVDLGFFNVKGKGEIKKGIMDTIQDLDKRVYVHTTGFTFPELPLKDDVEKMIELASIFPNSMEEKGKLWIIKAILKDYETLGLSDDEKVIKIKEERKLLIEKCASLKSEILSKLETINQIRGHPEAYQRQDLKKLSQYQEELVSLLSVINKKVSQCMSNPDCETKTEDLKISNLKELDRLKKTPQIVPPARKTSYISIKYEQYKQILGNPKNGEISSTDGKGKYVLYDNGGIFWHPELGSFEVHGPIFERYEREGMERGRLGYPTSDEEYVPLGYRRNTFQYGGIYFTPTTNKVTVGIGSNPTGYQYELKAVKFIGKGIKRKPFSAKKRRTTRSVITQTFPIARNIVVSKTKIKFPYLPTGPSMIHFYMSESR